MGSSPSVTLAFASSVPSCIARPPPCRTRMPGDAMHLVEQRARDPLHLAGGERAVVEQVSARRVAPFAIGRQDCREQVDIGIVVIEAGRIGIGERFRAEEHTSELQSLMRISYAVFCLKKQTTRN